MRLKSTVFKIFLLMGLGLLIYSNALSAGFVFDDFTYIEDNPYIRNIIDFGGHFKENIPRTRASVLFSFFLNYQIHQLDPFGYHLTNILIHLITTLFVWWLYRLLLNAPLVQETRIKQNKSLIAFTAALFFVAHPAQTQAVTYISQRFASMSTLFYVATLCFYLKGRLHQSSKTRAIIFFMASILCALLAVTSKEIAITLPLACGLVDYFVIPRKENTLKKKIKTPLLFLSLTLIFILFINILFPGKISTFFTAHYPSESHEGDTLSFYTYQLTQSRVWLTFFRLLLFPVHQNIDYDFPMSESILNGTTLASLLILISLLVWAIKTRKKRPLISFSILWMYLTLSANLVPRANVIFEHKLYLVSVGYCLLLSAGIHLLCREKKFSLPLISVIIIIFSFLTFQRNKVWKDSFSLWSDCARKSPNKPRPNKNLANEYARKGQFKESLVYYDKALSLKPEDAQTLTNRGLALFHLNELDKSLADFNKAIELDPDHYSAYGNRGLLYEKLGEQELALSDYSHALKIKKNYVPAFVNKASLYNKMGQYQLALSDLNKAIIINPHYFEAYDTRSISHFFLNNDDLALKDFAIALSLKPEAFKTYSNRGYFYLLRGKYDLALKDFDRAIEINRDYAQAYTNRGYLYRLIHENEKALQDFNKAIKLSPLTADAYNNRGSIYITYKKYDLALQDFNKAIEIEPLNGKFYNNRGFILNQLGEADKAFQDFEKAVELDPENPEAHMNKGLYYLNHGMYDLALLSLYKALAYKPKLSFLYYNIGLAYAMKQEYAKAAENFSLAIQYNPQYAEAYQARALAYKHLDNWVGAEGDMRVFNALKQENP